MKTILQYCNAEVLYTLGKNKYLPNLSETHPLFRRIPKLWQWYDRRVEKQRKRTDKVRYKMQALDTSAAVISPCSQKCLARYTGLSRI